MKLFCRAIKKEDLSKWEKLAKSEFLEEDFCSEQYLLNKWACLKGWVVMTSEKEWIGCCFIDSKLHHYNPKGIHFLEYCVFPKFRGQHYAKYLLKLQFDHAIGFKKSVCINPNNTPSISLATKYGFKPVELHKTWMIYICEADYYPPELKNLELEMLEE